MVQAKTVWRKRRKEKSSGLAKIPPGAKKKTKAPISEVGKPHRLKQSKVDGDKDGDKDGIGAWSRCGLSARLGHGYKGIQRRFGHLATCAFEFCVVVGAFGSSCCSAVHCVLQIG